MSWLTIGFIDQQLYSSSQVASGYAYASSIVTPRHQKIIAPHRGGNLSRPETNGL
jgi:hypothetical protein